MGLILTLGVMEGVLRYQNPRSLRTQWAPKRIPFRRSHPVYGHGLVPGGAAVNKKRGEFRVSYRINSLGLRDREFPADPPRGVTRLLALGDSFTEGYGVELKDTFVKGLARRLNAAPPRAGARYEAVNMGVSSYSPLLEYLSLKAHLPRLRGNFVLLNLDVTDFTDDFHYQKGATWGPEGEPLRVSHEGVLPNYFSYSRQFLEALPGSPWRDIYVVRFIIYKLVRLTHDGWAKTRLGRIEYDHHGWTRPGNPHAGEWEAQLGRTFGHILRIHDLAMSEGMGFALAAYPHGHMVHPEAWCAGRRALYFACGRTYPAPLYPRLMRLCAEKGLTCWDLTDEFKRPDAPSLFYGYDGHLTPKGNEIMAEALERRLRPLLAALPERP